MRRSVLLIALALAACGQLPPTPDDLAAKRFEPLAEKAVIYIVRDHPDHSREAATIFLDEAATLRTYPGTYYRWETAPGARRISGFGPDTGAITLHVEAGRIYFVRQRLAPFLRYPQSYFHPVSEAQGRAAVMRSQLLQ